MIKHSLTRCVVLGRKAASGALLAALLGGCGGAVGSGAVVGKVGQDLAPHAQGLPQGAAACAAKEGVAAQPGADKASSEACDKEADRDELWRKTMVVLAAYGETLDAVASGADAKRAGRLEAARTGVRGDDWAKVEDGSPEKAARIAATQLVDQMRKEEGKDDIEQMVKEAAPRVKTVCEGLLAYLEDQASAIAEVQRELEKKRGERGDRRCTMLDNRSICVGDSASDRVVYAHAMGQLRALEENHLEARDDVAGFCAAHAKLAEAAEKGKLSDDATYDAVVEAVRAARKARPNDEAEATAAVEPAEK